MARTTSAPALLAAVSAAGGQARALAAMFVALTGAACEEVPSAIQLSHGTEVPEHYARRQRAKLLVLGQRAGDASDSDAEPPAAASSGSLLDADAAAADDADAQVREPMEPMEPMEPSQTVSMDVSASCPVQISLQTVSYGSGDEAEEDFAPNNVGAIWITKPDGEQNVFVRTVLAWGPTYFDQALTWIDQTRGNLVDTVTLPTRPGHMRAVEASWDCRDTMQQLVAAGTYRVNLEFTEVEAQGPVLTGERALQLELGDKPSEVVRAPQGYFGEVRVRAGMR